MGANSKSFFDQDDENQSGRLARKIKESPFMVLGLAGCVGVVGWGAYRFKNRGTMSPSVFLMQLRVAAQGTVVASLTLGLAYTMANEYIFNKPKKE